MRLIYILALLLSSFVAGAQTNQPLPSGSVPISNTLYLAPDSTVWTGDEFEGLFVKLGKYNEIDSIAGKRVAYIATIPALMAYAGQEDVVAVLDTMRGGLFTWHATGSSDNGTTFPASGKGSGYWHRVYNPGDGLNVLWYGAKNDGTGDNSQVFRDVIFKYSGNSKKVVIPYGTYNVTRMIGDIDLAPDTALKNDVAIIGIGRPRIICTSSSQIQAIFGITMDGYNLTFDNLFIDGANKAARGIYLKSRNASRASDYTVTNCVMHNFFSENNELFSSGAIRSFANIRQAVILNNQFKNITCAPDVITPGETGVNAVTLSTLSGYYPKQLIFRGNWIENVYSLDSNYTSDQVGIVFNSVTAADTTKTQAIIEGNRFINCRTRFVKLQARNVKVRDNTFMINNLFIPTSGGGSSGVDVQYDDGIVEGNDYFYIGYSHTRAAMFSSRTGTKGKTTFVNNKVNITGDSTKIGPVVFVWNENASARVGNTIISDNLIRGKINYLVEARINGEEATNVLSIDRNNMDSVGVSLAYVTSASGGGNKSIRISASNNVVYAGSVPVATKVVSATVNFTSDGINNVGVTPASAVYWVTNNGISSSRMTGGYYGEGVTNTYLSGDYLTEAKTWTGSTNWTQGMHMMRFDSNGFRTGRTQANSEGYISIFKGGSGTPFNFSFLPVLGGDWVAFTGATSYRFDQYIQTTQYRLSALNTAPASASATGTTGEIRIDANYIYICTATNTWKRVAISTW